MRKYDLQPPEGAIGLWQQYIIYVCINLKTTERLNTTKKFLLTRMKNSVESEVLVNVLTTLVLFAEAGKAPSAGKNGKRSESGSGGFFTWFIVLALLGVWSSVAVVYFDLVDYQGVLGE